jgi:hypothetical protein
MTFSSFLLVASVYLVAVATRGPGIVARGVMAGAAAAIATG